jgi:hypothetical protein
MPGDKTDYGAVKQGIDNAKAVASGLLGMEDGSVMDGTHDLNRQAQLGSFFADALSNFAPALNGLPLLAGMAKKAKQTVSIPAHDDFFKALGVDKKKVMADVDKLQRKHLDQFPTIDDAENHLKYVFGAAPDAVFPASDFRYTLHARNAEQMPTLTGDAFRAATTDFTSGRNGNYWVRNAMTMPEEQVALKRIKEEAGIKGSEPIAGLRGPDEAGLQIPGQSSGGNPSYGLLEQSIAPKHKRDK